MIAVSGALLGIVLGAVAAYSIAALAGWSVAWSPLGLLVAVLLCVAVGLTFGPAWYYLVGRLAPNKKSFHMKSRAYDQAAALLHSVCGKRTIRRIIVEISQP